MSITVYTLPNCVQCEQTKKYLSKNDITFNVIPLDGEDPAPLNMVQGLGYASAPVIIAGDAHWSGFRPDMLSKLVQSLAA